MVVSVREWRVVWRINVTAVAGVGEVIIGACCGAWVLAPSAFNLALWCRREGECCLWEEPDSLVGLSAARAGCSVR